MSKKLTIQEMQNLAKIKKGECLSIKYTNAKTKLKWKCEFNHTWMAVPHSIKIGTWCPSCIGKNKTIQDMQKIAASHNGKCLSKQYLGSYTRLQWKCQEGHVWKAMPTNIISNHWCPYCAGQGAKTIEDMQILALKHNGKCLSNKFFGTQVKLKWQCKKQHVWETKPNNIQQNKWCPKCATGRYEQICRQYMEKIFNNKFPKSKPKWLVNHKTNHNMELDGFCENLKIAFEHNGAHHYEIGTYSKNYNQHKLQYTQFKDDLKRKLCKKHNIILIEIPQLIKYIKIKDLKNYIIQQFVLKSI